MSYYVFILRHNGSVAKCYTQSIKDTSYAEISRALTNIYQICEGQFYIADAIPLLTRKLCDYAHCALIGHQAYDKLVVSSSEIYYEKAGLIEMLNPTNLNPGEEQHETFVSKTSKKKLVQYDYRALDGELFSCVKATLADCHLFRDAWLEKTGRN